MKTDSHRRFGCHLILLLSFSLLFQSESLRADHRRESITLESDGKTVVATIEADGAFSFNHFKLEDELFRVVVDLEGTTNPIGIGECREIPSPSLVSVRTSQFSRDPLVSRVVFDFEEAREWRAEQEGDKLKLSFSTPGEQGFPRFRLFQDGGEKRGNPEPVVEVASSQKPEAIAEERSETVTPKRVEPVKVVERTPEVKIQVAGEKPSSTPPPGRPQKKRILPQREKVRYLPRNSRDPFASLLGRQNPKGFVVSDLPSGENLKLVGIVNEGGHFKALCENDYGIGYILAEKDRLKDGYVASVEDDRVVFIIQRYGWSHRQVLELPTSAE
jgi:hypothetical protein